MSVLTDEVKRIANSLGANYLRAVSMADFNERVRDINLSDPLAVLINVPEIDNTSFELSTSNISNVTIEILFVKKNENSDDTGEVIQSILDDMETLCNGFYDLLYRSTVIAKAVKPSGFTLSGVDTINLSDELATGWLMKVTVPLDRKVVQCG
jgi:hypothetical protein